MAKGKRSAASPAKRKRRAEPKAAAAPEPAGRRGAPLVAKVLAHLAGPRSPIGRPVPLDAERLAAAERSAGVALSPAMHAWLSFDAGYAKRD